MTFANTLQNKLINHPMKYVLIFHLVLLGLLSAFLIVFPMLIDALLNNPGITTLAGIAAIKEYNEKMTGSN